MKHDEKMAAAWTACVEFNRANPIGTRVSYTAVLGSSSRHDVAETVTKSEAWTLPSGEAVVMVAGKNGGVSLGHIEVLD